MFKALAGWSAFELSYPSKRPPLGVSSGGLEWSLRFAIQNYMPRVCLKHPYSSVVSSIPEGEQAVISNTQAPTIQPPPKRRAVYTQSMSLYSAFPHNSNELPVVS